ncbi:hypothetical protein [Promicromonospora soli]
MSTTTTTPLTTELRDAALAALERLGATPAVVEPVETGAGLPVVSPLSGQTLLESAATAPPRPPPSSERPPTPSPRGAPCPPRCAAR